MKITIEEDFRGLKKGDVYDFDIEGNKHITVVGDNGCGKTSLFMAMRGNIDSGRDADKWSINGEANELKKFISVEHSFEKIFYLNTADEDPQSYKMASSATDFIHNLGYQTKELSHGQRSMILLVHFLKKITPQIVPDKTLLILDEPDKGVDLKNIALINNKIKSLCDVDKISVLFVSHNPISSFWVDEVYDFSNRKMYNSSYYVFKKSGILLKKEIDIYNTKVKSDEDSDIK